MPYQNQYRQNKYLKDRDWEIIQQEYDKGLTYKEVLKRFKISPKTILKAQNRGLLKFRDKKDAWVKSINCGRRKIKDISSYQYYKKLCSFKFNLSEFPFEFDFKIIEEFGWYKAKNNGDNPNGVSRDHKVSIKYGFENKIDPEIISHPANCELILQKENSKKNSKNSLTLQELLDRIENCNLKYGRVARETVRQRESKPF